MPKQPRGRACHPCHVLKIKCELGAPGGGSASPPCSRCVRLGKECVVAVPRRQKDRVAELEAKVEALTKLLEGQGLRELSPEASDGKGSPDGEVDAKPIVGEAMRESVSGASGGADGVAAGKKRKLADEAWVFGGSGGGGGVGGGTGSDNPTPPSATNEGKSPCKFDQLLDEDLQQRILDHFTTTLSPMFPVMPLTELSSAQSLRNSRPLVLDAILFAATPGFITVEVQDQLILSLLDKLVSATLVYGEKSFELLQALQITSLWYRSARKHSHIATFQLISIASGMAVELGFGGPQYPSRIPDQPDVRQITEIERQRTWLVCYLLVASTSIYKRAPSEQKWTDHHERGVELLETSADALPSDRLLAQFVRAEKLFASISDRLAFAELSPCPIVGDPFNKYITTELDVQIRDFVTQIPSDLNRPSLSFLSAFADMLVNEPVLHSPTNKQTFAAPYSSESKSMLDIPAPLVTEDHVNALYRLRTACHALLDSTAAFSDAELLSLPSFQFPPRIAYATFILLKLHIAVTAPGNTYGSVMTPEDVRVEAYIDSCIALAARARKFDPEAVIVRILGFSAMTKEWLTQYEKSRFSRAGVAVGPMTDLMAMRRNYLYERGLSAEGGMATVDASGVLISGGSAPVAAAAVPAAPAVSTDVGWDSFVDFGLVTEDFGLADLFAGSDLDAWMADNNYVNER